MNLIIFLCGIHSVALAIFHIFFWKLFNWKSDLKSLSYANRAIIQILNTRLIYFFLFVAFLCFAYPNELANTSLGKVFLAGICLFWLGRTVEQFIFFKKHTTAIHILTIVFIAGAILFALPLLLTK
jgi:hypothetical protein